MTAAKLDFAFSVIFFAGLLPVAAQQLQPPASEPGPSSDRIHLDVVVNTKSGQPVTNLNQQDFTVLDNKSPRPITSFKVLSAAQEPVTVFLFLDAVNTPFSMVAYMRQGVEKFLQANEGKLAHPTTIAVLTDKGVQIEPGFSINGLALSDAIEHQVIGLREINRSSEWSGDERLTICVNSFSQLLAYSATIPGRKIILWISPGWPLVSGPRVYLSNKQLEQIFSTVVDFSTRMRQDNVTLYNINPVGVGESLERADYYQAFLKGVAKFSNAQAGDLGVQVLATQSGGLVIESNSDVAGNIQRCLTDANSWYEITFDPPPADKPNEYHHIDVKLDQPGLIARTRDGYYSNVQSMQHR